MIMMVIPIHHNVGNKDDYDYHNDDNTTTTIRSTTTPGYCYYYNDDDDTNMIMKYFKLPIGFLQFHAIVFTVHELCFLVMYVIVSNA